jgi:hypothetical protein
MVWLKIHAPFYGFLDASANSKWVSGDGSVMSQFC